MVSEKNSQQGKVYVVVFTGKRKSGCAVRSVLSFSYIHTHKINTQKMEKMDKILKTILGSGTWGKAHIFLSSAYLCLSCYL